ncbi:hypothetical protein K474DRAFT_1668362 [Panus rudis PR-1116 ss-1]|nr:hypothetical protein K474DRAFT_1668362 [Panus rudis PR-1116 ss-1]
MTSSLAAKAGRKLFERNIEHYTPVDPLYETYTDKKGRQKRRRRALPPGLSARDEKILRSVQKRAHYLDKGFSMCGLRFGWTFVIGIIPGAGDAADAVLNYVLVVRKAKQAEIPGWLLSRMLVNNAISAGVGLVPFVGDIVLAAFKANSRNAALLEEYLRIRGEEFLKANNERIQDPNNVKPGAGTQAGERVPGKEVDKKASGGWFRRKSRDKGKAAATATGNASSTTRSDSRFVENVDAS